MPAVLQATAIYLFTYEKTYSEQKDSFGKYTPTLHQLQKH